MTMRRKMIVTLAVLLSVVSIVTQMFAQEPDTWFTGSCWSTDSYMVTSGSRNFHPYVDLASLMTWPWLPQKVTFTVYFWKVPFLSNPFATSTWAEPSYQPHTLANNVRYRWHDAQAWGHCFWGIDDYGGTWRKMVLSTNTPYIRGEAFPYSGHTTPPPGWGDGGGDCEDDEEELARNLSPFGRPLFDCHHTGGSSDEEDPDGEEAQCGWYYWEISYDAGETWEILHVDHLCGDEIPVT